MKEIKLPPNLNYYREVMPVLSEYNIEHTYFSERRIIAFVNDEDASIFVLQHEKCNTESVIDEFRKTFSKVYVK